MKCDNCGAASGTRRFCCVRCKWTWHNRNRTLTPNVVGKCAACGSPVSRWESPKRTRSKVDDAIYCGRVCAGSGRRGANHPNWTGGKRIDRDGYVLVYNPDHPYANSGGCVREHRLVMERKIKRILRPEEVIHHRNGNVQDNRIRNLKLYPNNAAHKAEDINERIRDNRGRLRTTR